MDRGSDINILHNALEGVKKWMEFIALWLVYKKVFKKFLHILFTPNFLLIYSLRISQLS